MTARAFLSPVLIIATALALTAPIGAQSAYELFQQALSKERAEGKLQDAIALYQRVIDAAGADHGLAAKALLQLGRCYETLGNAEARAAYESLIARYPDQSDVVAQAKARLAILVRTTPAAPRSATMTVRPLPSLGDKVELMSVSPDGTKAILIDYSKGQNIALYDYAKRQTRLLTDLDWSASWTYNAVWSPDARRVAYMQAAFTKESSELRVTTLEGRPSVVYRNDTGLVWPVAWTPDGATLVAVVGRPDNTVAVGTIPAAGGRFTALQSFTWGANGGGGFRLSPDGRFVAYDQGERGLRDIHVVSLDGRESYRLTDNPADDFAPVFSPDSQHIVFTSARLGSVGLWTVQLRGGKPVGQPVKLKEGMESAKVIDWIDRGIFVSQTESTSDLYTVSVDPNDGRATGNPRQIPYPRTGRNVSPVWSPDGTRLAFVSSSAAQPNRRYVVVMSADGAETREFLIPTSAFEYEGARAPYDLRWFGDGRGLGFSAPDARFSQTLFRLRLETGEWDTIPLSVKSWTRTDWNVDGSAFYFVRHPWAEENGGIFEKGVNDDAERRVYRAVAEQVSMRSLQFSRDRKSLAFEEVTTIANNGVIMRIIAVDVTTGATRTVLEKTTDSSDLNRTVRLVSWSPSGDLLIWRSASGNGSPDLVLAPVNGGAPRPIALQTLDVGAPRDEHRPLMANWSPTGRSIVLVRESQSYKTFLIENPLVGLRSTDLSSR